MERARHEKTAIIIAAAAVLELIVLHVRMRSPHLFFVWLAQSFLHGRLDIAADSAASVGYLDLTMRQGMFFLPLGPFPAVVLAPLVALYGTTLSLTSALHVALAFVAAWLAYRLARAYGLDRPSATWLALAFCLGSTAFGVLFLEGPWYFA
ncbi:MAG TPA: hypothetical protein VLC10_01555, partial [Patescibacteria group bacterium]|nr:hypothetical protein [Patescibacteria group bacterium]